MKELSILGLQVPITPLDTASSILEEYLKNIDPVRNSIIILPERWISDVVEVNNNKFMSIVNTLCDFSMESSVALVPGSFLINDGRAIKNSSPFIVNGKVMGWQEKISPFLNERLRVSGGNKINTFDFLDLKIGIAICYDIDFPYYSRILAKEGCDLIINPALIVENFHDMWHLYVKARSIENRIGIVSVNSSTEIFSGESIASFPFPHLFGAKLNTTTATIDSILDVTFNYESIRDLRKKRLEEDPGEYIFNSMNKPRKIEEES